MAGPATGRGGTSPPAGGLSVREVLEVSSLRNAKLLAGASGLDRIVSRLNVMEVPDVLPWVKPHELLLTTGYPLRHTPQALDGFVGDLDERGLAALAIKLGRYIDELPQEMLDEADRLGFPVVLLPDGVGFDDILNQVLTEILNRQAAALARSEEIHRALVQVVLAGGGLQEVTDEVSQLVDAAVLAVGVDGRVLTTAGTAGELDAARSVDGDGRLTEVAEPGSHTIEGLGVFIAVPVIAGSFDHGSLVAFRRDGELPTETVSVLERAATVVALAITRELAVSAVESKYQADLVRDLVEGRQIEPARVLSHCRSFGWDLDRQMVVLVAECDEIETDGVSQEFMDRLATSWRGATRARDGTAAVVAFSGEVVAVVGADLGSERITEISSRVNAELGRSRRGGAARSVTTGISRPIGAVTELPAAYQQARRAVQVGRQMHGAGSVAHFDDLGVFRLLSLVPDGAELRSYVAEVLGPLAAPDDAEAADLRETLQVLLETNLNVAESSRRLHFHYNTLRYRIGKLERLVGAFSTDPVLRLNLLLALQILRMRGLPIR